MKMKTIGMHYIDTWNCLEICLTNKQNIFFKFTHICLGFLGDRWCYNNNI